MKSSTNFFHEIVSMERVRIKYDKLLRTTRETRLSGVVTPTPHPEGTQHMK